MSLTSLKIYLVIDRNLISLCIFPFTLTFSYKSFSFAVFCFFGWFWFWFWGHWCSGLTKSIVRDSFWDSGDHIGYRYWNLVSLCKERTLYTIYTMALTSHNSFYFSGGHLLKMSPLIELRHSFVVPILLVGRSDFVQILNGIEFCYLSLWNGYISFSFDSSKRTVLKNWQRWAPRLYSQTFSL